MSRLGEYTLAAFFGMLFALVVVISAQPEPLDLAKACASSANVETLEHCIEDVQAGREPFRK